MWVDSGQRVDDGDLARVLGLAAAAATEDGVAPLSEQTILSVQRATQGVTHLLARSGEGPGEGPGADEILGYAQLDARPGGEPAAELVVAPASRRCGIGARLLDDLLAMRPDVRLWAHGQLPGARALAASRDLRTVRLLLKMSRPLSPADTFPVALPAGYTLSTYDGAGGRDADDWLAVNAAAFADHAEQGRMTRADLADREGQAWFDPAGFFVVRDPAGALAAFHWTKVERGVGEVYVVGVSPDHQGLGLGRAVTAIGLAHLRDLGLDEVDLYVDGHNAAAIATYVKQGFTESGRDAQLARTPQD